MSLSLLLRLEHNLYFLANRVTLGASVGYTYKGAVRPQKSSHTISTARTCYNDSHHSNTSSIIGRFGNTKYSKRYRSKLVSFGVSKHPSLNCNMANTPTLVLHFDINKTIIMEDPAGKKTTEDVINDILASACWGTVGETEGKGLVWSACVETPSVNPPHSDKKKLVSYKTFVDQILLPYPPLQPDLTPQQQRSINRLVKDKRTELVSAFTNPGQPGERYRKNWFELSKSLKRDGSAGYHYVLPSFFRLLLHLVDRAVPFRLVFRTFGDDLKSVIAELNRFCTGEHPDYPGVSLPQLKVDPDGSVGSLFRSKEATCLVMGTTEKPPSLAHGMEFYHTHGLPIHVGYGAIYEELCRLWGHTQCMGLTDYYEWWAANNEHGYAGKLFLVNPEDTNYRQVFFDDNIETDGGLRNIVDVRNPRTEEPLPLATSLEHYLVRVEPFEAIPNPDYFIDQLNARIGNGWGGDN
eukprot:comp5338_c0_seq1/m.1323 comp5338_c0_seq1/g.1323  ORF comp5338_c0_seq1/g.1323 comp5338_c0_seq1/m.1323 type:complete len:465 (-) comp5338_c0_seq1:145-1539(-)